jgi:hypothetical protein
MLLLGTLLASLRASSRSAPPSDEARLPEGPVPMPGGAGGPAAERLPLLLLGVWAWAAWEGVAAGVGERLRGTGGGW